jgi:hypothetical protein
MTSVGFFPLPGRHSGQPGTPDGPTPALRPGLGRHDPGRGAGQWPAVRLAGDCVILA